jgi:hypothetical protein
MGDNETLALLHVLFTWLLLIHTLEEIAQGIFELEIGRVKMNRQKYLRATSGITTINLGTLALIIAGSRIGLCRYFHCLCLWHPPGPGAHCGLPAGGRQG